jgi:hypothetical protein
LRRELFLIPCLALVCLAFVIGGCFSSTKKGVIVAGAGEKATVGPLTYSVIDTEIVPQLGEDPVTARTPKNRFFLLKISASNSGNDDATIPGLVLVDDSGEEYMEVGDGANVPNWLGVVRKVGGAQTEQGTIVFDAPAKHYRLRVSDETDPKDIFIDVPLTYVHEQMKQLKTSPDSAPQVLNVPK